MSTAHDIVLLSQSLDETELDEIGSRAASRATLNKLKLPTPKAFVITPNAFYRFIGFNNGMNQWRTILNNTNPQRPDDLVSAAQNLQKLILHHSFDDTLSHSITATYDSVIGHSWAHVTISPAKTTKAPVNYPLPVIKGDSVLFDFVRQIWSAQITPHALSLYLSLEHNGLFAPTPIIVSQFEPATISGTVTTIDPLTNDKNLLKIEVIWGTNPQTDPQLISPDSYLVAKTDGLVVSHISTPQKTQIVADHFGHYRTNKVPPNLQSRPKLTDTLIHDLTTAGIRIHDATLKPQRINWLAVGTKVYFTRFTELERQPVLFHEKLTVTHSDGHHIAEGLPAAPGITTAPLMRPSPHTGSFFGRIIVVKSADVQLMKRMKEASGLIIESGGLTSELAQAAREIGIPTVVGTGPLILDDGQVITLNAGNGQITQDKSDRPVTSSSPSSNLPIEPLPVLVPVTTVTKVYVTVSHLQSSDTVNYLHSDGVGVCRGADSFLSLKSHPKHALKQHRNETKQLLISNLKQICDQFGERPVYYLPYDCDSRTSLQLAEGNAYETVEENPMFGFRGAFRIVQDPQIFEAELECLLDLRHKQQVKNLHVIIPFVRSVTEFVEVKKMVAAKGLYRSPTFKIFAELGTPSSTSMIPEMAKIGLDGFLINLDILTALTLGYDPNSAEVDQCLNSTHPTVLHLLADICHSAAKFQAETIVTGHQLDQFADTLSEVIQSGTTGISVSPSQFSRVKSLIQNVESRLIRN